MTQNPFTPVFQAQRTAVEQSQAMTHDVLEAQKTSFGAFANAVSASEPLVEQNADFTKGVLHATLDALEANMPEDAADFGDVRAMIDEQFDALTEAQLDSLETVAEALEESEQAYGEFADSYSDVVDSSFDAFLDAHEQLEANVDSMAESVEEAADEFDTAA